MAKRISDPKFMRSDPFCFDGEGRPIRTRLDRIFGSKLMPLLNLPHQESHAGSPLGWLWLDPVRRGLEDEEDGPSMTSYGIL